MTFTTTFRYLHDARQSWRNKEPFECVICGLALPGYGFIVDREDGYDKHHVCEPCLISGRLAERSLRVNDADRETLERQIGERAPEMAQDTRAGIVAARTAEVEERTPRPAILNEFVWPAHCGDYGIFFQRVYADDLERLAPGGDGKAFFAAHLPADLAVEDEAFIEGLWDERLKGFMRFYLWQCSECASYFLTWDSD